MTAYKAMQSGKMVAELKDDASKWAAAFIEHFPDCGVDEDTMLGWFANAIEVSHDHRMDRLKGMPLQDPDPVAALDTVYEHMGLFEGRIQALEESVRVLGHNEAQIQAVAPIAS